MPEKVLGEIDTGVSERKDLEGLVPTDISPATIRRLPRKHRRRPIRIVPTPGLALVVEISSALGHNSTSNHPEESSPLGRLAQILDRISGPNGVDLMAGDVKPK